MRTLMTGRTAPELPIWARLVLDLDELSRVEWATLEFYAVVRGIKTREAARRNLYRVKATLAGFGVELVVEERRRGVDARFATQALADLLEPDLRAARAILERLEARRQGREPDLEGLARETGVLHPATIAVEYRGRGKSFAWIARKHGVGKERVRRILVSTGPIRSPRLKRRVEERRPVADLARALDAADRGASLEEIAAILACSRRSARRFLARHGRSRATGRPAQTKARDGKATFTGPAKPAASARDGRAPFRGHG